MKPQDLDRALAAIDPLNQREIASLPLAGAEEEFLAAVIAEPLPPTRSASRVRVPRFPRVRRPLGLAATAVFSGLLVFFLISASDGGRPTVAPASAYAAELSRLAAGSPRILVGAPGWHVEGLQAGDREGEMQFLHGDAPKPDETVTVIGGKSYGEAPAAVRQREVALTWTAMGPLSRWVRDRASGAELSTTAAVLDTTARVFQYSGGTPGDLDITALWEEGGLVVEYRAPVRSLEAFKTQLASLERVDARAWLDAMPASVVRPAEFEPTVQRMLEGIPLPPGFTAADVIAGSVPTDRYQLGASVASSVSCTWFARWAEARRGGDRAEVNAAVSAMASVGEWPVIRRMAGQGAYGQILGELAGAMPKGSVYKQRPLEADVESALGCGSRFGIPIPGTGEFDEAHASG